MLIHHVSRRSPVSGLCKTHAANCMATCSCLHAACSNAALADATASKPAESCSCSTASDAAATPAAYPAAAGASRHLAQPAGGSMCSVYVSPCSQEGHSGITKGMRGGECHAHAITTRTWLAGCSSSVQHLVRTFCPFWQAVALCTTSHGALCCIRTDW